MLTTEQVISQLPDDLKSKFAKLTKRRQKLIISRLLARITNIHFVFEDISDPHNLMAATRSLDVFGFQFIHIIFNKQQGFNPRKVGKKTSASANKWLTFYKYSSVQAAITQLKNHQFTLIATTLDDTAYPLDRFIREMAPSNKYAILLGNEHRGLSKELVRSADLSIKIPMYGFVESLNLSVSASILAWEISKKIRVINEPRLAPEKIEILKQWLKTVAAS